MSIKSLPLRIRASIASRLETRRWNLHENRKRQRLNSYAGTAVGPIFIFGCQRSGTTHVERLFRADPRSRVFGEFSELSITSKHTVWHEQDDMKRILAEHPGEYWVVRSLLASHDTVKILNEWPDSTALWIYRDANSVVDSMVRKWQGDFREISECVETDQSEYWALRELWEKIEAQAAELAPHTQGEARWRDVYALYWYARNALILDLNLVAHPRVLVTDYIEYTHDPDACLKLLWNRIGVVPPKKCYPLTTRPAGHDSSHKPRFSPLIQDRCDALYAQLRKATHADQKGELQS